MPAGRRASSGSASTHVEFHFDSPPALRSIVVDRGYDGGSAAAFEQPRGEPGRDLFGEVTQDVSARDVHPHGGRHVWGVRNQQETVAGGDPGQDRRSVTEDRPMNEGVDFHRVRCAGA